jgi:hypothetical protein
MEDGKGVHCCRCTSRCIMQKKKKCGRKKVGIDMSTIPIIPLNKRTTIRALAHELDVKKPILHCCFKLGMICRHSNTLKPYLRDDNKKERLPHCVCMIDGDILHFIPMKNIIHSDEKWFNTTKKLRSFTCCLRKRIC